MTAQVKQQNPDGSWSEAVPLGWQGPENQVDWEVYRRDGRWVGEGFNRARRVGVTRPCRTRVGVMFAALRISRRRPMTFLWDQA